VVVVAVGAVAVTAMDLPESAVVIVDEPGTCRSGVSCCEAQKCSHRHAPC
jgi:hypothetical protein